MKNEISNGSNTIGVIFSRMLNEWNISLAHGIKDAAFETGINVIQYCNGSLMAMNPGPAQFNIISELVNTDKLNALIISSSAFSTKINNEGCERICQKFASIPVVLINKQFGPYYSMMVDGYQAIVLAVKHLVEVHYYRNIALMNDSYNIGHCQIVKAFRETMNSFNLPVNEELIITNIPNKIQNTDLLDILLKLRKSGVEAIIAAEGVANKALYILLEAGVKVPDEIAVMGISNLISSRFTLPPLSTIEHSFFRIGRLAVKNAISLINGESAKKITKLEPVLIRRGSCGCFNQTVHEITDNISINDLSFKEGEFLDNKDIIVSEIGKIVNNSQDDHEIINELLLVYNKELERPGEYIFLNFLQNFLKTKINFYVRPNLLHKILSLLIKWSIPSLKNRKKYLKIQYTWQQARLLINYFSMHKQAFAKFQIMTDYEKYFLFSSRILSSSNREELLNVMAKELSANHFPFAYLVLYENPKPYKYPDPAPLYSHLVMAYTEKGRIKLDESGIRFLTEKILPDNIWREYFSASENSNYCIIESLALDRKQIRYIIFGISGQPNEITYWLKNVISNSLQRAIYYSQFPP